MPTHSSLTGSELHENKGVASATTNSVATAVSGATSWQKIAKVNLDPSEFFAVNQHTFQFSITNSAATADYYIVVPFDCSVIDVFAVSTSSPSTTGTATFKQNGGSTMATLTALSTDPINTAYAVSVTTNNTLLAGDFVKISTSGSGSGGANLQIALLVEVTG